MIIIHVKHSYSPYRPKNNVWSCPLVFVLFSIFISFFNIDLISALSISASSLGNIGPGLGSIGPYDNWGHLPSAVKIISTFCMLLGRLEIFTVMVLISRLFFK